MKRYGISYLTYDGGKGHCLITAASQPSYKDAEEVVSRQLAKEGRKTFVTGMKIEEMKLGAWIASNVLMTAANILFK